MPSTTRHIQRLNEYASKQGLQVKYFLATEEEYTAYRAKKQAFIRGEK
jgi:hypothetical protein